jgi:hypothetical protein
MACQRFAGALRAYAAGGELPPALRAHLGECGQCRGELARERALVASIDRDLAHEMGVEVSVDFEARVRERIASQPAGRGWMTGWRPAFAVASLVVIASAVGLGVLRWGPWQGGASGSASAGITRQAGAPPGEAEPASPTAVDSGVRPAGAPTEHVIAAVSPRKVLRQRAAATAEPEVLVPPDQQLAIARLLDMIRAGTLDERAFQEVGPPLESAPPIVVEELKVPPIVVVPGGGEKQ